MSDVKGEAKLIGNLSRVQAALVTDQYLRQAGQFVRAAAVLLCPADTGYLRQSIYLDIKEDGDTHSAEIFTNVQYARYVEFGTGMKGAENHSGISPNVTPTYTMRPWYIHESQIDPRVAEKYHFHKVYGRNGEVFYECYGQPAQPFMYPALHDNERTVLNILKGGYENAIRKAIR